MIEWLNELMTNELMTDDRKNQKTLIVAATYEELAPTFEHFGWQKTDFIEQQKLDVLITGVGMTATGFSLGKHLNSGYSLVINVGISGSFDRTIMLGDLVNITTDSFSELGAEDGDEFISIEALGFGKSLYATNSNSDHPMVRKLPTVNGITVNTVHGSEANIKRILERYNVKTESMEGAAVFYACEHFNIPALQIRSISNYVEHRNKDNWKIGLAIKNLNDWLINYIDSIK